MRQRRPQDRDVTPAAKAQRSAPVPDILALQQSAGNHAVSSMLARKSGDKPEQKKDTSRTADFGKDAGVIVLESASFGGSNRPPAGTGSGTTRGKMEIKEAAFASVVGDHSTQLMLWVTNGKIFDTVVIVMPGLTVTLHKAVVSSYQMGGGDPSKEQIESWSLNFESVEFKTAGMEEDAKE